MSPETASYAKYNIPQRQLSMDTIHRFYDHLTDLPCPANLLDFGCGDGSVTLQLANFNSVQSIHAVDISNEMLALAYCMNDHRKITYHSCDLQKQMLSIPPVDVVTSFNAIHWVRRVDAVLANIRTLMKPGARFIGVTMARDMEYKGAVEDYVMREWSEYAKPLNGPRSHGHWMEQADTACDVFGVLLSKAGFMVEHCECVDFSTVMNKDEVKGFLAASVLKYVSDLPESQRPDYLDDIFKMLTNTPNSGLAHFKDGLYQLQGQALQFCAKRAD